MPRHHEIEAAFARALLSEVAEPPPGVTSHSSPHPVRRFGVYRNNVAASLIRVLEGRYRVVERLVGEEFFRATARIFIEQHPPRSPALVDYGGAFAEFLSSFAPAAPTPYLVDVARLEWLEHVAYHAADAVPIGRDALGAIAPDHVAATRLRLHPSLGLIRSDYPVFSIWRTNVEDEEVMPVSLGTGEAVMIVRPRFDVEVRKLPAGTHAFLAALEDGQTLAEAATAAMADHAAFNLASALAGVIGVGAVVGYH
ncbi:MAG: DNA-binding domain-containing protein [Hyphomicrobiaceae bacterium]